jgi:non-heme chloroperoxidase
MEFEIAETVVGGGVTLSHIGAGDGDDLVLLPGWSQTAELFDSQIEALSASFHVTAIDHRGHGRSETPASGFHVHRLAADLHDLLIDRHLQDVRLLGHSMGCAVIWAYLELFGPDRLSALVLVDQMPYALRNPEWSDDETLTAGATLDATALYEFTNALRGTGPDPRLDFLSAVTSDGITDDDLARLTEQNLLMERTPAAHLIHDVATHDWRPLVARIELPTLVVAGNSPNIPIQSQRWMSDQIAGSRFVAIEASSGGTHFPFFESPTEFNETVADFLAG